jgi:Family of unknown function (DUF6221)
MITMAIDLTARIAGLASLIEQQLAEDEAAAKVATDGPWEIDGMSIRGTDRSYHGGRRNAILVVRHTWPQEAAHIARNDPARVLRRVKATRELVAAILAEQHEYVEGDSRHSCWQALMPDNPGGPCDCGRDQRVARLLGIIASEWEDAP